MSIPNALRLSRAPAAGLTSVGLMWGSFAALVPDIKARVGASDGELGMALLMSALAGLIAMWSAPRVTARLGRHALPLFGACICVSVLLPILPWNVVSLGAVLFVMGITVSLLDISSNVQISALEARHGVHLMNINHAMFSFGFGASAWVVGMARRAGAEPYQILPLIALAIATLVLLTRTPRPPADAAPPSEEPAGGVPWAAVALTGIVLFASFVGENAIDSWSALHIERTLGAASGEGSFGPAALGLMMGIGRMSGQVLSARLGDAALIFGSALLAIGGTLMLASAPTVPVAVLGVAVAGLGLAVIVPSANSILGARVREAQRSYAISRAWMLGIVGFFIGPSMMGVVAELFGLRMSFIAIAALISVILPAVWLLSRQPPVRARTGSDARRRV